MTIAVEPMVCAGGYEIEQLSNGWTVVTADHSMAAHYENTILITDGEPRYSQWQRICDAQASDDRLWRNVTLAKDDVIELEARWSVLPNTMFTVDIGNGHTILAHISGKLRMNFIQDPPGDKVTIQMSPYDLTRGHITWRNESRR